MFEIARDPNAALLDFTNASNANTDNFTVGTNVEIIGDPYRKMLSENNTRYLIADGVSGNAENSAAANFEPDLSIIRSVESLQYDNDHWQVWTTVYFESQHDAAMRKNRNTMSAATALQAVSSDRYFISDAQFAALTRNTSAATPEYALSRMQTGARTIRMFADTAAYDYFDNDNQYFGDLCATVCNPCGVIGRKCSHNNRLWGGYVGEFGEMERHGLTESYRTSLSGIIVGAERRIGTTAILGIYGGYMGERMRFRSIRACSH